VQVIPPAEDFQVVSVWNQCFSNIVDFLWLLRLASPLRKDDVRLYVEISLTSDISFHTNQASFLGMLEVKAVTFGYLSVYCLLDPGNFINHFVTEFVKDIQRKAIFCVYHPNK